MLDNTFGLLGFSYAVIGRRSNLMLRTCLKIILHVFSILGNSRFDRHWLHEHSIGRKSRVMSLQKSS